MRRTTGSAHVVINGEARELDVAVTIESIVDELSPTRAGLAVALNGEVLTRSAWASTHLDDGDRVEVLSAAPGG